MLKEVRWDLTKQILYRNVGVEIQRLNNRGFCLVCCIILQRIICYFPNKSYQLLMENLTVKTRSQTLYTLVQRFSNN